MSRLIFRPKLIWQLSPRRKSKSSRQIGNSNVRSTRTHTYIYLLHIIPISARIQNSSCSFVWRNRNRSAFPFIFPFIYFLTAAVWNCCWLGWSFAATPATAAAAARKCNCVNCFVMLRCAALLCRLRSASVALTFCFDFYFDLSILIRGSAFHQLNCRSLICFEFVW